jgi:SAM-dependent methyltransferase
LASAADAVAATYDTIGRGYARFRRADPRIAARIEAALGDAGTVLNVGAGAGSYEPAGLEVTAVEPSEVMIAQRPPGAAPVVRGTAEDLPFDDGSFDAAMAIITAHHWPDAPAGIREMMRVARRRVVLMSFDPEPLRGIWLHSDYFPRVFEIHAAAMLPIDEQTAMFEGASSVSVEVVPVPSGCSDCFFCALWDRPEMHLDPEVRNASSVWHAMEPHEFEAGLAALRADLESGRWDERHGHLRQAPELDVGLRLIVAELAA